jgi:hypothetical protein
MDIVRNPVDVEGLDKDFRDTGGAVGDDGYVRHCALLAAGNAVGATLRRVIVHPIVYHQNNKLGMDKSK